MQREAFNKLYSVAERVHLCDDRRIKQDWDYLQASNNFRFMTTKQSGVGLNRGIYESPFDAFTNYMNILGDFIKRVDSLYPVDIDNEELNALLTTIQNQGAEIEELHKELEKAQAKLEKIKAAEKKESKATAKSAAENRQRPRLLPKSLPQRKQLKRLLNNIGSLSHQSKSLPLNNEWKAFYGISVSYLLKLVYVTSIFSGDSTSPFAFSFGPPFSLAYPGLRSFWIPVMVLLPLLLVLLS